MADSINTFMDKYAGVEVIGGVVSLTVEGKRTRIGMLNKDGTVTLDDGADETLKKADLKAPAVKPAPKKATKQTASGKPSAKADALDELLSGVHGGA